MANRSAAGGSDRDATYFDRAEQYRREASDERDRFKLLLDVNNTLVSTLDPHSLWSSVLETVRRTLDHDYASLVVFSAGTRELHLEAAMTTTSAASWSRTLPPVSISRPPPSRSHGITPRLQGSRARSVRRRGIPDVAKRRPSVGGCVPLSTRRGVLGALNIASRRAEAFSQTEVDLLRDVAGQVAIAVENTVAFREISDLKNRLAEEKLYLEDEISSQHDFKEIIGSSPALRNVLQQIQAVAPTDATVLLLGETGQARSCWRGPSTTLAAGVIGLSSGSTGRRCPVA